MEIENTTIALVVMTNPTLEIIKQVLIMNTITQVNQNSKLLFWGKYKSKTNFINKEQYDVNKYKLHQ